MSKLMRSRHIPLETAEPEALDKELAVFLDEQEESGHILRALRESKGWTLYDLASQVGIEPEHLDAMENGFQPISEDLAERFSEAFHVRKNIFL